MTKKQIKQENAKKRGSWMGVNPCTKVVKDKKKEQSRNACRKGNW